MTYVSELKCPTPIFTEYCQKHPFICNNNNNNNNNLSIEIQRMWKMKCFVIPVIIGATGIVSKSLQKYLETIPGQHSIDSLQKLSY
jgi:hypothetical protein